MSCGSLWRCVACCRRLGRLLCAAAVLFLARYRPRPLTRAARAASRFGGARLADGALVGYSSRRFYWYWLGIGRGPQREQHELLVASAVRGLLPAPLVGCSAQQPYCTVLARHRPRPATRATQAAGRYRGARCADGALTGCCAQRPYCFLARHRPRLATSAGRAARRFGVARPADGALAGCCSQRSYCFLVRRRPTSATRAARAAGRFGGAWLAAGALAGCSAQRPYCLGSA
jgi:hypothetical protein